MWSRLWHTISYLGLRKEEYTERREQVLLNRILSIALLLVIGFIPIEVALNGFRLVPIELVSSVIFSLGLYFNYRRWFTVAKYYSMTISVSLIFLMTYMVGGGSDSEYNLFPLMLIPLLLFRKSKHAIPLVLLVALSFYLLKYTYQIVPPLVEIPLHLKQKVVPIMNFMTMALLFFELYYFKRLNHTFQDEIIEKKQLVEEAHQEIKDSIEYARRIQQAILPTDDLIRSLLPESFVLYKPKDVVAGDFYWLEKSGDAVLFAVADCTGHGVPGAMVSVVCHNALNRAVREFHLSDPGEILDKTRELVLEEFSKSGQTVKDGMDIALCKLEGSSVAFAGAYNPLFVVRNDELMEWKADRQPVGNAEEMKTFTTHHLDVMSGDMLYLFSDGYADQFGGPRDKKYGMRQLKQALLSLTDQPVLEQQQQLDREIIEWMVQGHSEQIDDICIWGIRIR